MTMRLIEESDNLTMCYDFTDKRLSFIIKNSDKEDETQINISPKSIDKLRIMLEHIPQE